MGYCLVSRPVIMTPTDVQYVYRCPKKTFILHQKYNISVSNMLSQPLKMCRKKAETNTNFNSQDQLCHPAKCYVKEVNLLHSKIIMLQTFTEVSVILQQTENTKTNNNIPGYHLVNRHVTSTAQMFSLCRQFYKIKLFSKLLQIVFVEQFRYSNLNQNKPLRKLYLCK